MKDVIFIVEDDASIKETVEILLEKSGYEVYSFSDGKSVIKMMNKVTPDLILCDIMMPGIDGYQVFTEVEDIIEMGKIPFLFLTAKTQPDDLRKGMALGVDDYIFKPFDAADLIKSVEVRLKKSKQIREVLKNTDDKPASAQEFLFLTVGTEAIFIRFKDIKLIKANGNYTETFLANGKTQLIPKLLKEWEMLLSEEQFIRIHRSTIVNIDYITKIEKWFHSALKVYIENINEPVIASNRYSKKLRSQFK